MDQTVDQLLADWMRAGFQSVAPDENLAGITVVPAAQAGFGDYQCNQAMAIGKRQHQPPRTLAGAVQSALPAHPAVARLEIAGPGFINIHISDSWLAERVNGLDADPASVLTQPGTGHTVLLDYSSPNVAKPMHIGHIRSTVIGNALDRLHRALGYRVISDNHLGDWGTQFGIILMGYRNFLDHAALAASPVEELERIYVKSYEKSKQDPAWLDAARAELVKLQSGDADNLALWKQFVALSLGEFQRIYDRLNVRFDFVRGESWYHHRLESTIELLRQRGLVSESEGAQVVFLEEEKLPPCIVRKSDGGFNYAATDIATVLARVEEFAPDAIIYVTDERQQLHFRQVFAICRRLGVTTRLEHIWFGLMRLPEGTFSTRQGNVIKLERLLDEAEAKARQLVDTNSPGMSAERRAEVARAVGIGAVKYADLSHDPRTMIVFSW
ncbi:MAG: arginine--tRNA ligase, partial [bacterium]